MNLSSVEQTRQTFARVIRRFNSGHMEADRAKTFAYLFSQLLAYWRVETEKAIEERLDRLEEQIERREETP
jgi:hypothetical protein